MTAELPEHPETRGSVEPQPSAVFAPCDRLGGCALARLPHPGHQRPVPPPPESWTQDDAEMVALALHTAETADPSLDNPDQVGHWPTVAGWLAVEVRRLRALLAAVCPYCGKADCECPQPCGCGHGRPHFCGLP